MPPDMPLDVLPYDPGRPAYRPYRRISTEDQRKGLGLLRQEGMAEMSDEAIAARLGLALGPAMIQPGMSGFRGKNINEGVFAEYLKQVRARLNARGDVIGIDEWSRLTRMALSKSSRLVTELFEAGVGIYI